MRKSLSWLGGQILVGIVVLAGCGSNQVPAPPENEPPVAIITAPSDPSSFPAGVEVTLVGSATDPEEGPLPEDQLTWASDRDGVLGTGSRLSVDTLSVGLHIVTLTARDRQGQTGKATATITIEPLNSAPQAILEAPPEGATFRQGETIEFRGIGNDAEEGPLPAQSLVWTSDRDGQIGIGPSLFVTHLSAGIHTITLSVTDGQGAQGTSRITISVVASNNAPVVTIHSPVPGSTFSLGEPIPFIGSAVDVEDGVLRGDDVVWSSHRDGQLATGTALVLDRLSPGSHTIVLLAADHAGATGTDTVSITVEKPTSDTGSVTVIID